MPVPYFSLNAGTKYRTPKIEEGKVYLAHSWWSSVHNQQAPRQGAMAQGQHFQVAEDNKSSKRGESRPLLSHILSRLPLPRVGTALTPSLPSSGTG